MKYDYLIVGSGLFGSVFAYEMTKRGKKCLVIEKRSHIGGNVYTEEEHSINVHKYGAHIFHTSNKKVALFIRDFDCPNKQADRNNDTRRKENNKRCGASIRHTVISVI